MLTLAQLLCWRSGSPSSGAAPCCNAPVLALAQHLRWLQRSSSEGAAPSAGSSAAPEPLLAQRIAGASAGSGAASALALALAQRKCWL